MMFPKTYLDLIFPYPFPFLNPNLFFFQDNKKDQTQFFKINKIEMIEKDQSKLVKISK